MNTETSFGPEEELPFQVYPLGDAAIVLRFGNSVSPALNLQIKAFASCLEENPFRGMAEVVPAYCTLTVYYHPWVLSESGKHPAYDLVQDHLKWIAGKIKYIKADQAEGLVEIPVCYGGRFGPDLDQVALRSGLSLEEVIGLHSAPEYLVYMTGFAPGFPYLGGMDPRLETPRKEIPRPKIPAGSVGIAGIQTGIYPLETPGGWQLIGQTPLKLFDPEREPPALLQAGDKIRFIPLTEEEFLERKAGENGA